MPDRYARGYATLIAQHEQEQQPVDDEVRWVDIQRAIAKAMEDD